jgi:diguanylate cyclase (GGDEF)-like protein
VLAHYDSLTKLPNRVLFYDRLKLAIKRSKRSHGKLAVLFMDLDNFKEINDSLGHHAGDIALRELASRLEKHIRNSDTLARFGGDEFILLMEGFESPSAIAATAQKLARVISRPIVIKGRELYLTVSTGVAIFPDDGTETQELLKCADSAMYSAKKSGYNMVHYYKKEMTEKSLEKLTMETEIRRGMDTDEFELYYQPQINTKTNHIVGLEALVRWNHPEKGFLSPDLFIPIAEESTLIIHLGELILNKAAEQMKIWNNKGIDPGFVSVNVSVAQLRYKDFIQTIKRILDKVSERKTWLELEITESFTIENPKQAIQLLNEIREMGVGLAIDDFGTGYSSLSYLKNLPVNKLKIDRAFIKDIPENKGDKALVRAIVAMTKGLNICVIAEGVETERQEEFLKGIYCSTMQGYLFAKPMSVENIEEFLIINKG